MAPRSDGAELWEIHEFRRDAKVNTDVVLTMGGQPTTSEVQLNNGFEPRWFAVHTRSRHEKSASAQLRFREVETFLPLYQSTRRWRNGDHDVQLPLFPGYTFVHIPLKDRLLVLKVPGVVRLVGFNGTPVPLEDQEVEGLRCALASGIKAAPHPYLTVGRRVRITAGPLNGQRGILVRRKGALRVILSIELIQRSVLVDLSANELEPAG